MQLLQDGLVAMLAAIGLASIMWMVVKAVLYAPLERRRQGTVALIPAQGDGERLEEQLRFLDGLRRERGLSGRALLVDCGLNEEGRKLARLLSGRYRWVILCGRDEAADFLAG